MNISHPSITTTPHDISLLAATDVTSHAEQDQATLAAVVQGVLPDPLQSQVLLDAHGFIREASASAAGLLGYAAEDLRGRSLSDLAFDGWRDAAGVASARLRYGATETFQLALKGRSGRRSLVEMVVHASGEAAQGGTLLAWNERRAGARRPVAQQDLDQHLRMVYGLLQRHETERQQIATRLHDEYLPIAVMAKYLVEDALGQLASGNGAEAPGLLDNAVSCLRRLMSGIDGMSSAISPRILDDLGLMPALESLVRDQFPDTGEFSVQCRWNVTEQQIPPVLKLEIYRIVESALTNVRDHAHAANASVSISVTDGELRVFIEDDGVGFDTRTLSPLVGMPSSADTSSALSLGLASIRRRVEANGGRFVLDSSSKRHGTLVGGIWPQR